MGRTELPDLAFLDVETTGLSSANDDRICEIAILRCTGGEERAAWQSLINPGRLISSAAGAVNGITDEMVADAPRFADVADRILELIDGAVLVCHNAPFDLGFLTVEFAACGKKLPDLPVIDTLLVARRHFDFPSYRLGSIASMLSIDVPESHRAMADVRTTHRVFLRFWDDLERRGLASIEDLFGVGRRFSGTGDPSGFPPLIQQAIRSGRQLEFGYLSATGTQSRRVVTPLRLINRQDSVYLEGVCSMRSQRRTFRLDRIIGMKILSS